MNIRIGKYQLWWSDTFDFGLFANKKSAIYRYVLYWTLKIGYLGIHKYR